MPLPFKPSFKIFDPRKGEDYEVETSDGKKLSTLQNGLLVVSFYPGRISEKMTMSPGLSLSDFNHLIKVSIQELGKIGFFTISPLTEEVKQSQEIDRKQLDEMLGSVLGYFDIDVSTIEKHFNLRCRLATYAEWVIGSCERPFIKPKKPKWYHLAVYWDTAFLFTQIENIRCLSSFYGETGELVFFTRIYMGIDELLEPLHRLTKKISQTLEGKACTDESERNHLHL
jgi:hypothetical protein